MGYWGWRPLVCGVFISTWVTGCTIVASTSAPPANPTDYPVIALTSGRLPDPTAPPLTTAFLAPLPVSPIAPDGGGLAVRVIAPTCYPLSNRMTCLGALVNTGDRPLVGLLIEVVVTERGVRQVQHVLLDQRVVPPGGRAPYRAIFEVSSGRAVEIATRVIAGGPGAGDLPLTPLVEALNSEPIADRRRWLVSGTVINTGPDPLRLTQAIATLSDAGDRVLGYRVLALDPPSATLGPGESRRVSVEVFVLDGGMTPPDPRRAALHIEGERAPLTRR